VAGARAGVAALPAPAGWLGAAAAGAPALVPSLVPAASTAAPAAASEAPARRRLLRARARACGSRGSRASLVPPSSVFMMYSVSLLGFHWPPQGCGFEDGRAEGAI